ncbi:MAG: hypothetical protein ACRENK_08995 [Gemmatimonadaceae bacterium]
MDAFIDPLIQKLIMALLVILALFYVAVASERIWVRRFIAIAFFVLSVGASIWVLLLGWLLAVLGLAMALLGVIWKSMDKSPVGTPAPENPGLHPSGGLILPGLGLLAAPFANVFVLMPVLRALLH